MEKRRREVLAGLASVGTLAVAGCANQNPAEAIGPTETESPDGESTTTGGTTAGGERLEDHPAAAGLASQPTLGPDPADADGVIVAFEDPSCPRCKRFEQATVPRIKSELVEPGTASFVFRGYPVVYEWGQPATRTLEATYARSADAHWRLLDHYFENQTDFREAGTEEVYPLTREFLAAETDLEAGAVVAAAENGDHEDAVSTDLSAGQEANATATPTVFLFRDGRYRTRASGSVSFTLVKNALGV